MCSVFILPQECHSSHIQKRSYITNAWYSELSLENSPHSLYLGQFLHLCMSPCISSSYPQSDKKWKSNTELISEDLVVQAVGAQTISFWVMSLGFQDYRKQLGLLWGKQVFSGSWRGWYHCLIAQKESFVPSQVTKWGICLVGTFRLPVLC